MFQNEDFTTAKNSCGLIWEHFHSDFINKPEIDVTDLIENLRGNSRVHNWEKKPLQKRERHSEKFGRNHAICVQKPWIASGNQRWQWKIPHSIDDFPIWNRHL
jgi:hypothetical protein